MKSDEVGGREPCPCGSGSTYARCCKKRKFKWVRDQKGHFAKSVPFGDEVKKILKDTEERFILTFGRKPRKTDPVFVERYYVSEKDMEREMLRAMRSADVSPTLRYAHKKTGFIIMSPKDLQKLTPQEQEEWEDAIDEFNDRIEAGYDVEEILEDDDPPEFMREHVRKNQIVLGYFIDKHFNHYRRRLGSDSNVEMVAGFATTNFARTLKSIHILLENDVGYDAYILLRALYENYLMLRYVYRHPGDVEIFIAQLGILADTHEMAVSKSGTPIQDQILDLSTGKKIKIPTRWKMASALGNLDQQLYNDLYRQLSSYSHSEFSNVRHFIADSGFDFLRADFSFDAVMICHLLSLLFFDCLKGNSPCAAYLKRDLSTCAGRSLYAIRLMDRYHVETSGRAIPSVYTAVMVKVVEGDELLRRIYDSIGNAEGPVPSNVP